MKPNPSVTQNISLKDLLQQRRPHLFSDSVLIEEPILNKDLLSYYLAQITERKDENRFESFCRRLAEKEICPNLLPQTGPTGGGDSKVDSETYPVSEQISEVWYEAIEPDRSSKERWAFAFSAKKEWKGKVKSDVDKIIHTNRNYTVIYFISNQPIRDKDRAQIEDELRTKYNVDIRILDKNWIVEKIVNNNRYELVANILGAEVLSGKPKIKEGPLDLVRKQELEELEARIADATKNYASHYQLIEDCIAASLLARSLEQPRCQVEGRLTRAIRLAKKMPWKQLLFEALYNHIWTLVWWYDEIDSLKSVYEELESLADTINTITYYEKLNNIRQLSSYKKKVEDHNFWEEKKKHLIQVAQNFIDHKNRPTSSLRVETLLVLIELPDSASSPDAANNLFKKLSTIIKKAENHIDYPFEYLIDLLYAINSTFDKLDSYHNVINLAVKFWSKKLGEAERGKVIFRHAVQELEAKRNYNAIREFSIAIDCFVQYEHKEHFVKSLIGLSQSYKNVGLYWAALACLVLALNSLLSKLLEDGEGDNLILSSLYELCWLALRLGCPTRLLCAVEIIQAIGHRLMSKERIAEYEKNSVLVDALLSIIIFKTSHDQLSKLGTFILPIERLELFLSHTVLAYLLGHQDLNKEIDEHDLENMVKSFIHQPAYAEIPDKINWFFNEELEITTIVSGCKIKVLTQNAIDNIKIAEIIISVVESFFSSFTPGKGFIAFRDELTIKVIRFQSTKNYLKIEISENIFFESEIIFYYNSVDSFYDDKFQQWLTTTLLKLCAIIIAEIGNVKDDKAFKDILDKSLLRKVMIAMQSHNASFNIYGKYDKTLPWSWNLDTDYCLLNLRSYNELAKLKTSSDEPSIIPNYAILNAPEKQHQDYKVITPINGKLWDLAKWHTFGFGLLPIQNKSFPFLFLGFKNKVAAEKIFKAWKNKLGKKDVDNFIALSLITNIDKQNPYSYMICINSDLEKEKFQSKLLVTNTRFHVMTPMNSDTINFVKKIKEKENEFALTYAYLDKDNSLKPGNYDYIIIKKEINIFKLEDAPEIYKSLLIMSLEAD